MCGILHFFTQILCEQTSPLSLSRLEWLLVGKISKGLRSRSEWGWSPHEPCSVLCSQLLTEMRVVMAAAANDEGLLSLLTAALSRTLMAEAGYKPLFRGVGEHGGSAC